MNEHEQRRVRLHQHLRRHPGLSADELARALHLPSGGGVAATLAAMRRDGEADYYTAPRADGDTRPSRRWEAR